jgi:hypothetical protein
LGNSPDGCTTLENLRSTIQGHRDGHTTTHSPQSQATDRLLNKSCGAFWGGASVSALLAGLALSLSIAPAPAAAHPQPPRSQTASTAFVQQPACRSLCPWMADRPHLRGDLPIKNEHRCHARDGAVSVHRWRRTRRCFTADVSVFMAHLPGKPFGSVKLGQ